MGRSEVAFGCRMPERRPALAGAGSGLGLTGSEGSAEVVEIWDTFGLFESLLQNFEAHLEQARHIRSSRPPGTAQTHIAISGFLNFSPPEAWGGEEHQFITARVAGELSLEALEW